MSWLASFEVLPSPNHVLAKLAIFRGAEPSPHSPRATDSASVFYYYFKPFALFFSLATLLPLCPSRSPVSSPSLPYHLCTHTPSPYDLVLCSPSISLTLFDSAHLTTHPLQIYPLLSFTLALVPPTTTDVDLTLLPSASCLQAEMKISRLLAIETELLFHEVVDPFAPSSTNSLFLLCPWTGVTHRKSLHRAPFPSFSTYVLFLSVPLAKIKDQTRWLLQPARYAL